MPYIYGLQGAPAVGGGLPGLPQRTGSTISGADPAGAPMSRAILRLTDGVQQNYIIPEWVSYARVTVIGKGGRGRGGTGGLSTATGQAHGGGGAGLAATAIESVSGGIPVNISFDDDAVRAGFLGYQLIGGNGGDATTSAGGIAGVGLGGAINFNGGAGGLCSASGGSGGGGGGAAGRGGNGTAGGTGTSGDSGLGDPYATGGGPGGATAVQGAAPNTPQGRLRIAGCLIGAATLGQSTFPNIGINFDGCDGGGGASGCLGSTASSIPGPGLVLIELW